MTGQTVREAGSWSETAACAGADTEWFFPDDIPTARMVARVFCRPCPVRAACLERAEDVREMGLWGGHYRTAVHRPWKDLLR